MIVTATAKATAILNEASAQAEGVKLKVQSEQAAYRQLLNAVKEKFPSFTNDELVSYIKTESLAGSSVGSLLINMDRKV